MFQQIDQIRLALAFLAAIGMATAGTTKAGDAIYAVDVSLPMGAECGEAASRLDQARAWVAADAEGTQERVWLLAMEEEVRLVLDASIDAKQLAAAIARLEVGQAATASLGSALSLVQSRMLEKSLETPRVVLVTAAEPPSAEIAQQILMLQAQGVRFEWVAAGMAPMIDQLAGVGFERMETLECNPQATVDPALVQQVRALAAEQAGLMPEMVPAKADLVRDLGLDASGAFDVLARACEAQGVVLPEQPDLTGITDIARYLASAPKKAGRKVRGGVSMDMPEPVYIQTVYFGTNRAPKDTLEHAAFFSGDRASRGEISYGICHVSIPVQAHERGKVESPFLGLQIFADPKKHILLKDVTVLDREAFFGQLRDQLAGGRPEEEWSRDILVFIHGFNVLFSEAARRTAQIAYDVGFTGAPVMFSWPSDGKLYAYISDREDVEWSIPHIERFLDDLASRVEPHRIHLITHSMGTEGTLRALHNMALRRGPDAEPVFENVILAAPDFDAVIFSDQLAPEVRALARRWTVYASDKDTALNVSASLRFAPRLGIPIPLAEGVDTVDATGLEVTPWSVPEFHSYFATKQRVIADVISVLKGVGPESRSLAVNAMEGKTYWTLLPIPGAK